MRAEIHDLKTATRTAISAASTGSMPTTRATCCGARRGKLFRLAGPTRHGMKIDAEPKLVADLNDMTFEAIEAPRRATTWP